jgi:hypothetical protein
MMVEMIGMMMMIKHEITLDDPIDGNPVLPGYFGDGTHWALVQRGNGRTLWRSISITNTLDADRRTATGD